MTLQITGEVLAVTTENVTSPTGAFADFTSTTIIMFDQGRTTEVRAGRDFPGADIARLKAENRPLARLGVFVSKGRIYAESLLELEPVKASAPPKAV